MRLLNILEMIEDAYIHFVRYCVHFIQAIDRPNALTMLYIDSLVYFIMYFKFNFRD
jgi:hypothetical protein